MGAETGHPGSSEGTVGWRLVVNISRFLWFRTSATAACGAACLARQGSACGQGGERVGPPGLRHGGARWAVTYRRPWWHSGQG